MYEFVLILGRYRDGLAEFFGPGKLLRPALFTIISNVIHNFTIVFIGGSTPPPPQI